jgi:hypothetical protein
MIPAHLVFADINGHSDMPLETRADALRCFWDICESHRPRLRHDGTSFYETDNDSLMAGFSGVDDISSELDVISWALRLHADLLDHSVSVSFGIGFATSPYTDEWRAIPGRLPHLRSHLYFPDDLPFEPGRIDRRRLMGNPLIVASRLLALAKKAHVMIAFGFFQDAPSWNDISHLQTALTGAGLPNPFPLKDQLALLGPEQARWMTSQGIEPYGLSRNA